LDAVQDDQLRWEQKQSLPLLPIQRGVHHPITFANATHGFSLSGSTWTSSYTTMFYMYEASTDTWTDLTSYPSYVVPDSFQPRSLGYAVVSQLDCGNSKAYIGFGATDGKESLNDLWEFDMSTGQWTELASLPGKGRQHPAMNFIEERGEIHVGLGNGYINGYYKGNYNDWWSYSISTDSWTQLPEFPATPRHHPFYFAIGTDSYVGFGHSSSAIERDWYKWDTIQQQWITEQNFESYPLGTEENSDVLVTSEARVAGTQFTVASSSLCTTAIGQSSNTLPETTATTTLGFILSGDGSEHGTMKTGEFHVYDPSGSTSNEKKKYWRALPPHPEQSRWAPGSFVLQGTQQVYMIGGYDRATQTLHRDMWTIDVGPLFRSVDTNNIFNCNNKKGKFHKNPLKENKTSCAILKKKKQKVQNSWCTKFVAVQTHCPSICNKACNTCKNRNDVEFRVRTTEDDQTLYRCNTITKNKSEREKFCNLRTTAETKGRVKKICPKRCKVC